MIFKIITIYLMVSLFLSFVILPLLTAKQLISKNDIDIGEYFAFISMWPVTIPILGGVLVLGLIVGILEIPGKKLFSYMENKFK